MSDNTPDSAHDTSGFDVADVHMSDSEPSMEDILSSIRQIIADDKTEALVEVDSGDIASLSPETRDETSADKQNDSERVEIAGAELKQETTAPVTDTDEHDILDLIDLVDNNADSEDANRHALEDNQANEGTPATLNFDESLDLVVDEDASSYVTTKITPQETYQDTNQLDIDAISNLVSEPEQADEDVIGKVVNCEDTQVNDEPHVEDKGEINVDENQTSKAEDVVDEEKTDDVFTEVFDEAAFMSEATSENLINNNVEEVSTAPSPVIPEQIKLPAASAPHDEDMDLVKSLLADLMDEPAEEAFEEKTFEVEDILPTVDAVITRDVTEVELENTEPEIDFITGKAIDADIAVSEEISAPSVAEQTSVLDEILQQSVTDEIAQREVLSVDVKPEKPTVKHSSYEVEHSSHEDDIVVLPKVDLANKLSLLKKTASVAGLGTAAALLGRQGDKHATQMDQKEAIDETFEDSREILETLQENTNPEKDETMAQTAKQDTLLDEGTAAETSSAFASLTSAVTEKAKRDDAGPAIGDLVQEALKPMLKEWLDKNLKGIVERAVTKEVKRISSGK